MSINKGVKVQTSEIPHLFLIYLRSMGDAEASEFVDWLEFCQKAKVDVIDYLLEEMQ